MIADADIDAITDWKRLTVWRECGFEIVGQAISERSSVQYIKASPTDLIVCREKPPDFDAVKLLQGIGAVNSPPLCIVISADSSPEKMRECFLCGAVDFIADPISETILRESLLRAVTRIKEHNAGTAYRITAEEYFAVTESSIANKAFLQTLRELIAENEGTVITTQSAAEYFGFNKDYFGRLFKQNTGITFGEFYKRFRMKYAEKLLAEGRYKVNEVSSMLGFATADYFTAEFRKYSGKRPLEVRKQGK